MKRKISALTLVLSIFFTAVITFQITYISFKSEYRREVKMLEAGYSNSLAGKLKLLDERFRSLYIGDIDEEKLASAVLNGYIYGTGDRYGEYMSPEEYEQFVGDLEGEFQGIGISVVENAGSGCLEVVSVMPDSPALKAGILVGDIIVSVGDESVAEIGADVALSRLLGKAGTFAEFSVVRGDDTESVIPFSIERGYVTEQTVLYHMYDDGTGEIGVIMILSFDGKTADQFAQAVEELRNQGARALIFDVRYNPGGALDSIVEILDTLLPEGPIVRIENSDGSVEVLDSDASETDLPMAVLVNGSTASAAELFSSALQDYKKAVLVGTTTYGKGCMQQIVKLADNSAIRVTTNMYDPPFSDNYDGVGVIPDVVIEADNKTLNLNRYTIADSDDNQLSAAAELMHERLSAEE